MAHALADGRSILLLRSTRTHAGRTHSNILWNYGQCTIPRHLRDIYVTEYGVADLRGKSDEQCILAMLAIADARFIDALAGQAKDAGKLRRDFAIPDEWRRHTQAHLAQALSAQHALFPRFPFGSDFSADELALMPALQRLQRRATNKVRMAIFTLTALAHAPMRPQDAALLARLGLDQPRRLSEWILRCVLLKALRET
jgi:hypothetical protein